jgi:hypothetical protein
MKQTSRATAMAVVGGVALFAVACTAPVREEKAAATEAVAAPVQRTVEALEAAVTENPLKCRKQFPVVELKPAHLERRAHPMTD